MQPADLAKLSPPSDPRVHRDGEQVAYVVSAIDLEEDRYRRSLWLHRNGRSFRFTAGPADSRPRWSPQGDRLAFLRAGAEKGDKPQVAVIFAHGGEAQVVSAFPLGAEALEWSPDGRWLAVVGVGWAEGWEDLGDDERARRPRRIGRHPYRFDNLGWIHDRRRHLWLVDPGGNEEPRCLTPGDADEREPAWSPDGSKIAFISDRHPDRGLVNGTDVWEVDISSGDVRRLAERGMWVHVSYRPDGTPHLVGHPGPDWPTVSSLHRVEPDGSLTDLTGHLDRGASSIAAGEPAVHWVGESAFIGHEDAGAFGVVRVRPDGTVDHLVAGRRIVTGFHPSPDGSRLAFTASSAAGPGELFILDNGVERSLTSRHDGEVLGLVEPEHFRVISDGVEVDAWVYIPPGDSDVPVLVNIHGGPASQYGFGFFDEFQVYAAAGFGVVACNPRGSSGRGLEFLRAVVGEGWGVVDMADVTTVLDAALARFPRLDRKRVGIMGGSYGGFLTAWMIGHQDRFASAVVERGLVSYPSLGGTSDIGATFPASYTGADYPDGWGEWWEKSPLAHAHRISCPTLIIHAENDHRCPIEQGEQLLMALLRNGVKAEMVRFPDEGHEMSRSGSPKHRIERFEAILDWHGTHLGLPDG